MYRELVIKAYGDEVVTKIDQLRRARIDLTDLLLPTIMQANIEKLLEEKQKKLLLCLN